MWPFKKKPKIKVGQVWMSDAKNPFGGLKYTIVAVKGKYVQYKYGPDCLGDRKINDFTWGHDLIKEVNGNDCCGDGGCHSELEKRL